MANLDGNQGNTSGASLTHVVEKITNLLANENISIRSFKDAEIRENNLTKHRLLHDLNMAVSQAGGTNRDPGMTTRLKNMASAIRENMNYCSASAEAVREVLEIMMTASLEGGNDGTYQIDNFPRRK